MDIRPFARLQEWKTQVPVLVRQIRCVFRTPFQANCLELMLEEMGLCYIDLSSTLLLMLLELLYVVSEG